MSESGRLRHGDGDSEGGNRCRRGLMLTILAPTSARSVTSHQIPLFRYLGPQSAIGPPQGGSVGEQVSKALGSNSGPAACIRP